MLPIIGRRLAAYGFSRIPDAWISYFLIIIQSLIGWDMCLSEGTLVNALALLKRQFIPVAL